MTEKAQLLSLEAGSKVASAMKDVIYAAAGITGFAVESARDLVQYMVRRGQMRSEEADRLMREVEEANTKRGPQKLPTRADLEARQAAARAAAAPPPPVAAAAPVVSNGPRPTPVATPVVAAPAAAAPAAAPAAKVAKPAAKAPAKSAKAPARTAAKSAHRAAPAKKGAAKKAAKKR
ncbi:MAG TPA: hypothetical protein VHM67_01025 [Gemmatimonadaceae bacterium]|nr:hypothetical protein [Gemmatimonadaceae bacterium]